MRDQLIYFCVFCVFYASIIVLCEFLYRKGFDTEYSRKLAHLFSTLSSLFFPFIFNIHWYVLALGVISFVILFKASKNDFLPSINSVKRKTYGSYLLPISICIIYYIYMHYESKILFILPILILAISDSLAGLIGKILKSKKILYKKTILGTSVFFLSTFIISFFLLYFHINMMNTIIISLGIASITSVVELFSSNGIDNITIPLCVAILLLFLY